MATMKSYGAKGGGAKGKRIKNDSNKVIRNPSMGHAKPKNKTGKY